jgi:capsular polysaccharide biosynthesis protein
MLNFLIAVFLGAFGGLGLAFIIEYMDDRIEKIEDLEKELQLPILASIPVFEKKAADAGRF